VLLGGGLVTEAVLEKIQRVGALGIITGSARGDDLLGIVGPGLNPASTGDEPIGFTLVLTEGFGEIGMSPRRFELLAGLAGKRVAVSGATQVRAGVIRPELISVATGGEDEAGQPVHGIRLGDRVRIVRGRAFGRIGRIEAIPGETQLLASGGRALVFDVRLEDESLITVPRPNVELIS
jgi:hypothetical protein